MKKFQDFLLLLLLSVLPVEGYLIAEFGLFGVSHTIFILFVVVYHLNNGLKISAGDDVKYLLLLFSVLCLSLIFSSYLASSFIRLATVAYYIIIYIYVSSVSDYNLKLLFWGYSLPLLSVCSYTYFSNFDPELMGRFTYNPDYNPTWLAVHLIGVVFLGIAVFPKIDLKRKVIVILLAGYALYFIILAQARTTLFAFVGSFVLYEMGVYMGAFLRIEKSRIKKIVLSFFGLLVLSVLTVYYFDSIYQWMERNTSRILFTFESNDPSAATAGRMTIWENYLTDMLNNPLPDGVGTSGISRSSPHNNYILLISEASIIALCTWLVFHYETLRKSTFGSAEWFIIIFLLIASFGNDFIYYKYYWLSLYLFVYINQFKSM